MNNQTCKHCYEVNQEVLIDTPRSLKKAIRVIADNIKDGTITESKTPPKGAPSLYQTKSFSELTKTMVWDDVIDYYFKCPICNQIFHLSVETYHGSGGSWGPYNKE